jgi:hypothetical protein
VQLALMKNQKPPVAEAETHTTQVASKNKLKMQRQQQGLRLQKNRQPVAEAELQVTQVAPQMKTRKMKLQNQVRAVEVVNY